MPLPIQIGRISQAIHGAYKIVGRYRAQIDEVVVPVVVVDDLQDVGSMPEVAGAAGFARQAAVAGEFAYFRLEVPAGVGAIVDLLEIAPVSNMAMRFRWGSTLAAPAVISGNKQFTDGRMRASGRTPALNIGLDTLAAGIVTPSLEIVARSSGATSFTQHQMPNIVLGRRNAVDFLEMTATVANVQVDLSVTWREFLLGV